MNAIKAPQGLPLAAFVARAHPTDRTELVGEVYKSILAPMPQQFQYPVQVADGKYRSVAASERSSNRRPVRRFSVRHRDFSNSGTRSQHRITSRGGSCRDQQARARELT